MHRKKNGNENIISNVFGWWTQYYVICNSEVEYFMENFLSSRFNMCGRLQTDPHPHAHKKFQTQKKHTCIKY